MTNARVQEGSQSSEYGTQSCAYDCMVVTVLMGSHVFSWHMFEWKVNAQVGVGTSTSTSTRDSITVNA